MNHFLLNGVERDLPENMQTSLRDFLETVRSSQVAPNSFLSSIRVNGIEMKEGTEEDNDFLARSLEQVDRVEITTLHPREFIEDTLQTLLKFTLHLEGLSQRVGAQYAETGGSPELTTLVDGIETLNETVFGARQMLRIGFLQPVAVAEADLQSILKDLVDFCAGGHKEFVAELLIEHLPLNLREWRSKAIPALLRSHDS